MQSQVDLAVWLYFLNSHERKIKEQGDVVVEKYYHDKLADLAKLDRADLQGRVQCLEEGAEKAPCLRSWAHARFDLGSVRPTPERPPLPKTPSPEQTLFRSAQPRWWS